MRAGEDKKDCWLVLACNDNFIKVFSLKDFKMIAVLKGAFGNPLCIDLNKD
jgi:hypothetical protein